MCYAVLCCFGLRCLALRCERRVFCERSTTSLCVANVTVCGLLFTSRVAPPSLCRVQPGIWRRPGTFRARCTLCSSRRRRVRRRRTALGALGVARWPCSRTACWRSTLSGQPLGCTTGPGCPWEDLPSTRGLSWQVSTLVLCLMGFNSTASWICRCPQNVLYFILWSAHTACMWYLDRKAERCTSFHLSWPL